VWPHDEAQLVRHLDDAVRSGLLVARGFPPHATYSFKHALVQEVAYDSLLRPARKRVHERTARALCELFPQLTAAQPELLARHYALAGCLEDACTYYQRAAEKALEGAANVEAVQHVCEALNLLLQLPEAPERDLRELGLLTLVLSPLIATEGYACKELEATCERAHALSSRVGGPEQRWPLLFGLWYNSEVRGAFAQADRIAAELEALTAECHSDELQVQLLIVRGHAFWRGRLAEARAAFERVLAVYDGARHGTHANRFGQDPLVLALAYLNGIYSLQGDPARGRDAGERAIAHARQIGHPYSLVLALGFAATCAQMRADTREARRYAHEVSALAQEQGSRLWAAEGKLLTAYCDALEGAPANLQEGLEAWSAKGARLWHTHQLALLAEISLKRGALPEALAALERAQALTEQQGERFYGAEIARLRAELELARQPPNPVAARHHLRRAVELAHAQGAVLFEQRAQRTAHRAQISSGVFSRLGESPRGARESSA
jgi:predicted ATPase